LLKTIGGMGQSAPMASKLFVYVLLPDDYSTTHDEISEMIYNENIKIDLIIKHFLTNKPPLLTLE